MPKIYFFEVEKWDKPIIKYAIKKFSNWEVSLKKEALIEENADEVKDADIISVFIYSKVSKEVISKIPNLKLITTRSTGFDHIDIEFAKSKGIVVSNVPHYGENTVAEHTFALILALSRNIHKAYVNTVRGKFSIEGLMGFDLKDKTIGIIGTGRIGMHTIKIAKGFGMNVIAYDLYPNKFMAEFLGFKYVSFEELLKKSDIISLHAPYTKQTHHLINKDNIKIIKRGALLINTARGGLVETEALLEALDKGILAGAGLDTFEGEEFVIEDTMVISSQYPAEELRALIINSRLMQMDNVVFTPHIAFFSKEAVKRIVDTTIENINAFLNGSPVNVVNK